MAKSGLADYLCLLFSSRQAAEACKAFATSSWVKEHAYAPEEVLVKCYQLKERIYAVLVAAGPSFRGAMMPFWLDCGPIMSARQALANLAYVDTMEEVALSSPVTESEQENPVFDQIRERVVSLLERQIVGAPRTPVAKDDVYLCQRGMATIWAMSQWLPKWRTGTAVLLGYSFHSTSHVLAEYYEKPYKFFELGDEYDEVEEFVRTETQQGRPVQALFCEFPSNPLLLTPDLVRLREIASRYDTLLVVDDTISSFSNVDVLGEDRADILWSSLTKSFSGYSDCMGGSVVLNPCSKHYQAFKALYTTEYFNDLYVDDALVLEANSRDYFARTTVLNRNGYALASYLQSCAESSSSTVSKVWYPPFLPRHKHYAARMRPANDELTPGYGCLMTFEFDTMEAHIAFHEEIGKCVTIGPHLAGHITLVSFAGLFNISKS